MLDILIFSDNNHWTLGQRQDDVIELRVDGAAQQKNRSHPQRVRRRSRRRETTLCRRSGETRFFKEVSIQLSTKKILSNI